MSTEQVTIRIGETHTVSGQLQRPEGSFACLVLAHGAGAGMTHRFMAAVADGLDKRRVATLRFQFAYMEAGSKRPDRPMLAHAAVRAAVAAATRLTPGLKLFAGGKSFGARMTSQAQAAEPLPAVAGLVFFGFPLHPAGKPSGERARHLADVHIPMLFLQGMRDALADPALLGSAIAALGETARLEWFEQADHSFHVPARSGTTDAAVLAQALDHAAAWMLALSTDPGGRGFVRHA